MASPQVKICGLTRRRDILHAEEAGAAYVGAVLVPRSPRAVDSDGARRLFEGLTIPTVAVVVDRSSDDLLRVVDSVGPAVLQLHGDESPELVGELRDRTSVRIWKAVGVRGPEDIQKAVEAYGSLVDGFVLDTWDPQQRGGTGRPFPWEKVRGAVRQVNGGPLLVAAGGLNVDNVREAAELLRPDVVDVSSGVEVEAGVKDPGLVVQFIRQARAAEWGGQE